MNIHLERVDGVAHCNVRSLVTHHSPDGFEWGYEGSGPADLALNILESVLRAVGYKGPKTKCWDGRFCFEEAFRLHQEFKRDFVAHVPKDGGVIDFYDVAAWLKSHMDAEWNEADIWFKNPD